MDVPVLTADSDVLHNLMQFIYTNESTLTQFGALKIQIAEDCQLALKKSKPLYRALREQRVRKSSDHQLIYTIQSLRNKPSPEQRSRVPITTESAFWSTLSDPDANFFRSDVTVFLKKSFFYEKLNRKYFSIWHMPGQSLLQLLSRSARKAFLPRGALAHGPGAILPLATAEHGLSSLIYHHNGGARQWYVIPASEQGPLRNLTEHNNHDSLFIDPSVLDKHHIRYHRILQQPNELVVLAAGAATQSFVTDTCWSESCMFALPSWIRDGHAFVDWPFVRRRSALDASASMIDFSVFTETRIQQYIETHLLQTDLSKCDG